MRINFFSLTPNDTAMGARLALTFKLAQNCQPCSPLGACYVLFFLLFNLLKFQNNEQKYRIR